MTTPLYPKVRVTVEFTLSNTGWREDFINSRVSLEQYVRDLISVKSLWSVVEDDGVIKSIRRVKEPGE